MRRRPGHQMFVGGFGPMVAVFDPEFDGGVEDRGASAPNQGLAEHTRLYLLLSVLQFRLVRCSP
jgi:hypothetical protein